MLTQVHRIHQTRYVFCMAKRPIARRQNKNMWLSNPEINFFIHRSFSIFIFISNAFLFYLARKIKTNLTWIKFILILIIIEIIAGASMYYFAFPILSQPIHLLIAIIIFGLQFYWYLILDD